MESDDKWNNLVDAIFDDFTGLCLKHGIEAGDADRLAIYVSNKLSAMQSLPASDLNRFIHRLPLSVFLAKKDSIAEVCNRALGELRLLTGTSASESA